VIVTVSFVASLGSGIVISTTPSRVDAGMFLASTPAGSAIEREKDPRAALPPHVMLVLLLLALLVLTRDREDVVLDLDRPPRA